MNDVTADDGRSKHNRFAGGVTSVVPALNSDATDVADRIDRHHPVAMKVSTGSGDGESVGDAASCNGIDEPPTSPVTDPDEMALLEKLLQANRLVNIRYSILRYSILILDGLSSPFKITVAL